jgi:hypothetical protein
VKEGSAKLKTLVRSPVTERRQSVRLGNLHAKSCLQKSEGAGVVEPVAADEPSLAERRDDHHRHSEAEPIGTAATNSPSVP